MFERFFLSDYDSDSMQEELSALANEATLGHIAEVHGEPMKTDQPYGGCDPATFNTTLAAYLVGYCRSTEFEILHSLT